MAYYDFWVRSNRYHGSEPLTYSSAAALKVGQIVRLELNDQLVKGFVSAPSSRPDFKTKPIDGPYELPPLPAHLIALLEWLKAYYPSPIGLLTQQVLPAGNLAAEFNEPPKLKPRVDDLPPLTSEQTAALKQIKDPGSYLLHGITGSGKTRLYIEQALKEYAQGRSAIILTPEISLTSQLSASLRAVFGEAVVTLHSRQSPKARLRAWLQCLSASQPLIVVGPRSALFAPLKQIGLIVLDEAHETAYKQEQSPMYQAGRVAAKLASISQARLILGSATPSVSDYYLAGELKRPILRLTKLARATDHPPVEVKVIDRRDRAQFSKSRHLSDYLIGAIGDSLGQSSQVLLYLNRRGTARLVLCSNCGWQALCPNCHTPLTYHGDKHILRCHACGLIEPAPSSCPVCSHVDLIYQTAGTKAIADEVTKLFPGARIGRFDSDNIRSESFENQFDEVKSGQFNVIIGTQLIAKGLDLPKLNLAGVILADTSLYLPDYTAAERTFQLLTQVIGRVGRGFSRGQAVVQTYQPDHPAIDSALRADYAAFYKEEIKERQQFNFPPFSYLLKLSTKRASAESAETAANKLKDRLSADYRVKVLGPAPSFMEYRSGQHYYQLVVKAKERAELLKIINELPSGWKYDIDPVDLL